MENTIPENVQKAKEAIEAILVQHNVALVPVVIHQGDQTFSTIDIVSTVEQQVQQPVQPSIITPAV